MIEVKAQMTRNNQLRNIKCSTIRLLSVAYLVPNNAARIIIDRGTISSEIKKRISYGIIVPRVVTNAGQVVNKSTLEIVPQIMIQTNRNIQMVWLRAFSRRFVLYKLTRIQSVRLMFNCTVRVSISKLLIFRSERKYGMKCIEVQTWNGIVVDGITTFVIILANSVAVGRAVRHRVNVVVVFGLVVIVPVMTILGCCQLHAVWSAQAWIIRAVQKETIYLGKTLGWRIFSFILMYSEICFCVLPAYLKKGNSLNIQFTNWLGRLTWTKIHGWTVSISVLPFVLFRCIWKTSVAQCIFSKSFYIHFVRRRQTQEHHQKIPVEEKFVNKNSTTRIHCTSSWSLMKKCFLLKLNLRILAQSNVLTLLKCWKMSIPLWMTARLSGTPSWSLTGDSLTPYISKSLASSKSWRSASTGDKPLKNKIWRNSKIYKLNWNYINFLWFSITFNSNSSSWWGINLKAETYLDLTCSSL